MKQINLIVVGDIHFPESVSCRFADQKDDGVADRLISTASPTPLKTVMRTLASACQNPNDIQGILFCGDLTSRGEIASYQACVDYLNANLDLQNRHRWALDQLHVVPGNHDVDRSSIDHDGDVFAKFAALERVWATSNTPIIATAQLRKTIVRINDATVGMFSLNSCLGCGEKRYLPKRVRDPLSAIFATAYNEADANEKFALFGEQLDTPAFASEDVDALAEEIEHADDRLLPIVLAHHNILSQAQPRIDLYTEVINGGMVRTRLSTCDRPVLYCHGHIHKDPIEIIRTPDPDCGPLVSISAPRFDDGFLRLEIFFSATDRPLGCNVIRYRFGDSGVKSDANDPRRISFRGPRDVYRGNPRIREILNCVAPEYSKFRTILDSVRQSSQKQTYEKTVADVLLEAEWFGFLEILNRTEDHKHWQVNRVL